MKVGILSRMIRGGLFEKMAFEQRPWRYLQRVSSSLVWNV